MNTTTESTSIQPDEILTSNNTQHDGDAVESLQSSAHYSRRESGVMEKFTHEPPPESGIFKTKDDSKIPQTVADISASVRELLPTGKRRSEHREQGSYSVENYSSAEITPALTREIADAFREIFCNNSEYMVCQDCDYLVGASEAFGLPAHSEIPLSLLDSDLADVCCAKCSGQMEPLYDPEITFQNFQKKFSHDAYVTLLRSPQSGKISGFTFGYDRPMREVFEHEWKTRYVYTANPQPNSYNNYEAVLDTAGPVLSEEVGYSVDDTSEIFCWNCVAISPELRGSGAVQTMLQDFVLQLPEDLKQSRAVLGETRRGSKFHGILTSAKMKTIEVGSEDYVLIGGALKNKCNRWLEGRLKKTA